jgi:hypothetical protein
VTETVNIVSAFIHVQCACGQASCITHCALCGHQGRFLTKDESILSSTKHIIEKHPGIPVVFHDSPTHIPT